MQIDGRYRGVLIQIALLALMVAALIFLGR